MVFLDRQREMGRLEALVRRGAAGLVALWGRRRVGKTRLVMEWCRRHEGVYTVADQSAAAVQRRYFAEAVSARLPGFQEAGYPDWGALLRRLSREARVAGWRGPLVLDEFPYLVLASPALASQFQHWIDAEARERGLLVAIAGSSQHMMQGLVLDASAPLYGRALEAFALQPLPAGCIGPALGLGEAPDQVRAFAVWGGIPRYWELAEPFGADLDAAVDHLALDPSGPLHREPDRLLAEELPAALSLRPVLDVIGGGSHRLSEIAGRLEQPATSLSRPLARLTELGLVQREVPFGESEKASRRALYRIADPFFRFWFRAVAPHRALLAAATEPVRRALWNSCRPALVATAWEELCRVAFPVLLAQDEQRPAAWLPAQRWWHGTAPEWDAVTATVNHDAFAVAEAKWSDTPVTDPELEALAKELLARPLPPGLPADTERVLFVGQTASAGERRCREVRVHDAPAVMAVLAEG